MEWGGGAYIVGLTLAVNLGLVGSVAVGWLVRMLTARVGDDLGLVGPVAVGPVAVGPVAEELALE